MQEPEVFVDEKVYGQGDSIKTEIGYLKIDGWKILFEELSILGSNVQMFHDGTSYGYTVKCSFGHPHGHFSFTPSSSADIQLGDVLETHRDPESSMLKRGSSKYYFVHALPHLQDKPFTLELVISDTGKGGIEEQLFGSGKVQQPKPSKIYRYSVQTTVYTYTQMKEEMKCAYSQKGKYLQACCIRCMTFTKHFPHIKSLH